VAPAIGEFDAAYTTPTMEFRVKAIYPAAMISVNNDNVSTEAIDFLR
jgi:hypothetical protein